MSKQRIISCQVTFHPYSESYSEVITEVLARFEPGSLAVETGTMSSVWIGPEKPVWQKMREFYNLAQDQNLPFKLDFTLSNSCVSEGD